MLSITQKLILAAALAMLAAWSVLRLACAVRAVSASIRRMRRPVAAVMLAFAVACSVVAQKRGGGDGPSQADVKTAGVEVLSGKPTAGKLASGVVLFGKSGAPPLRNLPSHPAPGVAVSADDIARGWRVESVDANAAVEYDCDFGDYSNLFSRVAWWQRGGREMRCLVDMDGFPFRIGTNDIARVVALSGGTLWMYSVQGQKLELSAAAEWASFCPGVSQFWVVDTYDGARLVTWEDVFADRDGTGQYSAQIELHRNGDFIVRSNCVETVCRRINPDDWDGDGLSNVTDPSPTEWGGDFYGTSVEWCNAQCVNLFTAVQGVDGPVFCWYNPDAEKSYYWLDLEFASSDEPWTVRVKCDGPSDLGDMSIIMRTGATCRVPLLAGASYTIESDAPVSSAVPSDGAAQVQAVSIPGRYGLSVTYPLVFGCTYIGDSAYALNASATNVCAYFQSVSNACCACVCATNLFRISCGESCGCGGGLHDFACVASWEGYSRSFLWSGYCPCRYPASYRELVLDSPSVFFTDDNGGAQDSDMVMLTAGLSGAGEFGDTLRLDLEDPYDVVKVWTTSNRTGRVTFPLEWRADSHCATNLYVECGGEVSAGHNFFTIQWLDVNGRGKDGLIRPFAAYCPIVNLINNVLYDDRDLCNPCAIVTGTNACFAVEFKAFEPDPHQIQWSIVQGSAWFVGGKDYGTRVRVASSTPGQCVKLRVQVGDCRSRPIEMCAYVVDPLNVKLTVWIVGNNDGSYYASNEAAVRSMVEVANKIYEQIGVGFYIDSISYTNRNDLLDLSNGNTYALRRSELTSLAPDTGGLELYFVKSLRRLVIANENQRGIVLSEKASVTTLAHEIGHSFGCADIYDVKKSDRTTPLQDSYVKKEHCEGDWSNGLGCRYYSPDIVQEELIARMLMCGFSYTERRDMTIGFIHGYNKYDEEGSIDVGFFPSGYRRNLRAHR